MESRWHGTALVALAMVGAMLAGCNEAPPEMLDQAEAEALGQQGPARLAEALRDPAAAGLASSDGALKVTVPSAAPTSESHDISYRTTWGREGVVRLVFLVTGGTGADPGGSPQPVSIYCAGGRDILGNTTAAVELRPLAEWDDWCTTDGYPTLLSSDEVLGVLARAPDLESLDLLSARPTADGGAHASYLGEGRNYTAAIDARGRITSLAYKDDRPDNRGTYRYHYGARESIDVPTPTERQPAGVLFNETWNGADTSRPFTACEEGVDGTLAWTVAVALNEVPRSEFELQVWNYYGGGQEVAFPLDDEQGQDNGFTYRYDDADGDGRLTVGDTVEVTGQGWYCNADYGFRVWDAWAQAYLGERGMSTAP